MLPGEPERFHVTAVRSNAYQDEPTLRLFSRCGELPGYGQTPRSHIRSGDETASDAQLCGALDRGRSGTATIRWRRIRDRSSRSRILRDDAETPDEGTQHRLGPECVTCRATRAASAVVSAAAWHSVSGHG